MQALALGSKANNFHSNVPIWFAPSQCFHQDKSTASSLLEGVIVSVQDNPVVVGTGERVVKSRITITVRVGFYDMVKRTKVWERTFSNWGEYELEGNIQNNLQLGIKQAIEKLSEDILLATVANW